MGQGLFKVEMQRSHHHSAHYASLDALLRLFDTLVDWSVLLATSLEHLEVVVVLRAQHRVWVPAAEFDCSGACITFVKLKIQQSIQLDCLRLLYLSLRLHEHAC